MNIKGSIALVTGGNRGIGKALVQALLDAGAQKVYVGTRQLFETTDPRLQLVKLDITNASDIAAAIEVCQDIDLLINNAGISHEGTLLETASIENAREEIITNYLGTLAMCQAFAPILKQNGGGALVNILSLVSWYVYPFTASYSISKAAEWALTNGVRVELRAQGTQVVAVYAAFVATDMTTVMNAPKSRPEDIAKITIEGIAAGQEEILTDKRSQEVKISLTADRESLNRQMQQLWDSGKRPY
jgi:NAD(P)-dependent dehydrogenase (short-subunit alcohol dehydrogenase family)